MKRHTLLCKHDKIPKKYLSSAKLKQVHFLLPGKNYKKWKSLSVFAGDNLLSSFASLILCIFVPDPTDDFPGSNSKEINDTT